MMNRSAPKAIDWIAHHAVLNPEKCATIDIASGRRHSYGFMHDRVGRLATYLKSLGVAPGDRVGFLAANSTDILDIIFATWRIGGISLALNFRLTATELEYIVSDAGADVLLYDVEFQETIEALRPLVAVEHYVALDGLGGASEFESAIRDNDAFTGTFDQTMDDQCMLMYSSGTTGRPKGVIVTYGMLFYSFVNGVGPARGTADGVWLSVMPLFHIGGLNVSCLPALWIGGTTAVMRVFDPGDMLDNFDNPDLGITHTIGVPAMYNAMRMHAKAKTTDFSRMVTVLAGGASVPQELVEWWAEQGLTLQDGYGMTESAASNCINLHGGKLGTSGKALAHTEMRVVGPNGKELPAGEAGELWMRGPVITPGYWNNEEANKKAFQDGWFKSGDIARCDAEGYITIEDRSSDMYISGGENVYPAEVEGVLSGMDAIAEVAVIGVDDERWGETGCVVAVLRDGAKLNISEIRAHCVSSLAKFKHPNHIVVLDTLPRNATGKVKKFELRKSIPGMLNRES
ncbi:MAG: acid--CoA ligase [Kordiimonadales bacterium]|nr:MAG: acid--CoA ligase [Kordiimonadales bacterium]